MSNQRQMNRVTFNVADSGLIAGQPAHVTAIYGEWGTVKLATTAGSISTLNGMSVRRTVAMIVAANRPEPDRNRSRGR